MIGARKTRGRMWALLAVPLLLTSLAACSAPTPETDDTRVSDTQQWRLDFAACMREHGIDMEDPGSGGTPALTPSEQTPEREEATVACIEELGPSPAGAGDDAQGASGGPSADEMQEELVALAQCLRDLGYDVEDPAPGSGITMPADLSEEAIEQCAAVAPTAVPAQ